MTRKQRALRVNISRTLWTAQTMRRAHLAPIPTTKRGQMPTPAALSRERIAPQVNISQALRTAQPMRARIAQVEHIILKTTILLLAARKRRLSVDRDCIWLSPTTARKTHHAILVNQVNFLQTSRRILPAPFGVIVLQGKVCLSLVLLLLTLPVKTVQQTTMNTASETTDLLAQIM